MYKIEGCQSKSCSSAGAPPTDFRFLGAFRYPTLTLPV